MRRVLAYLEEELAAPQIVSKDIQHPNHLGEDEDSVAALLQTDQQLVQQNQLPTAADQLLGENMNSYYSVTRTSYDHHLVTLA